MEKRNLYRHEVRVLEAYRLNERTIGLEERDLNRYKVRVHLKATR